MKPPVLDTLLTFELATDVSDSNGGAVRTWTVRCNAWSKVEIYAKAQNESLVNATVTSNQRYTLTCRAPDVIQVLLTDRVTINGAVCNVAAIYRANRAIYVMIEAVAGEPE